MSVGRPEATSAVTGALGPGMGVTVCPAAIAALPSGVLAMSQDISGLVETSTNLGVVGTQEGTVEVVSCTRSSVAPALRNALEGPR